MTIFSRNLRWDPALEAWVPREGPPQFPFGRINREKDIAAGDAFAGGLILGICASGVLFTAMMGLAFAVH
jgi:sugar/nucleoside kinase (ribokinase family)